MSEMSLQSWRKNKNRSSKQYAGKTPAAEDNESFRFKPLALAVAMALSSAAHADRLDEIVDFNIPQQRADFSLTEFAKQADITLIFPFDVAMEVTANKLDGEYSVEDAIRILLEDTTLLVKLDSEGELTIATDPSFGETESMHKKNQLSTAIAGVISSLVGFQAIAQEQSVDEEVLVTGIRGSLQRAMDIKRNASGVVDAISAEDMGKFPDTNLAESLQRITGVSINRVNGEGSEVTVRGFGGGFNLVTLNGRQMPAANVGSITGNPLDQGNDGSSRSFDFSNLASEGVSGLQVYKTGRASVATGGIGATINIQTMKPLESGTTQGSVGVKLVDDVSGDEITPELSGLFSWANDEGNFGVSVFGSYQERDSGSRHASVEQYSIRTWDNTDPDNLANLGLVPGASITNEPDNGQLVVRPSNLGLGTNEDHRERLNGQVTLQYAPSDVLTITADALYAENTLESTSLVDGLWFNGTVDTVVYDGNPVVAAPELFAEDVDGGKDFFFQNLDMGQKDTLRSIGFNADLQVSDNFSVVLDYATSAAKSSPDAPLGKSVLRLNVAGPSAGWQAVDFSKDMPRGIVSIDDGLSSGTPDGIFNIEDVGTQVFHTAASAQISKIDQLSIDSTYEVNDEVSVDFGLGYLAADMHQTNLGTQNDLGGWGIANPGDIPAGLLSQECSICEFEDGATGIDGVSQPTGETAPIPLGSVSWRIDPLEGMNAIAVLNDPVAYAAAGEDGQAALRLAGNYGYVNDSRDLTVSSNVDNRVAEDIFSLYAQVESNSELFGMETNLVFGARYERTDVTSTSIQGVTDALLWTSNNDFRLELGEDSVTLVDDYSYANLLPSVDFSVDIVEDLKARASYSKTIARPQYSDLYTATALDGPGRITHLGDSPTAVRGNVALDPLESSNYDVSVEYYFGDANYVSLGYYRKDVANFIGIQQTSEPLFDLRDATATDSTFLSQAIVGLDALGIVDQNEDRLFSMTALAQNLGDFQGNGTYAADATVQDVYQGELAAAANEQAFHGTVFDAYNVTPVPSDPLAQWAVRSPTNSQDAEIDGFELAGQYFLGETGFGVQANYTTVNGDIGYDNGGDPGVDQFALPGLSDTANLVLIFEKFGFSGRLAANWRDEFLNQVNRPVGGDRHPEYVAEVTQVDLNVSYEFDFGLAVSLDAINLTSEGQRKFGRTDTAVFFVQELDPRYTLSARYSF